MSTMKVVASDISGWTDSESQVWDAPEGTMVAVIYEGGGVTVEIPLNIESKLRFYWYSANGSEQVIVAIILDGEMTESPLRRVINNRNIRLKYIDATAMSGGYRFVLRPRRETKIGVVSNEFL